MSGLTALRRTEAFIMEPTTQPASSGSYTGNTRFVLLYMFACNNPLKNITIIQSCLQSDEGWQNLGVTCRKRPLSRVGFLLYHICCHMGPQFFWFHSMLTVYFLSFKCTDYSSVAALFPFVRRCSTLFIIC